MKIRNMMFYLMTGIVLALSFCIVSQVTANEVTITGEVNEEFQIVAKGVIYEVADNEIGDYLVRNHISDKVKVSGTVSEQGGIKIITVSSFEVLAE